MPASSPIADLGYRNVAEISGRHAPAWWVIARTHIQRMLKVKSYWVLMVLSGGHYLITAAVTYFIDSFASNMGGAEFAEGFFKRIVWKDQFLNGFQFGHFLLMAILLLVGAGCIANDNRSNALLVYFSKPCSKRDYLVGKFLGVFLLFAMAMAIPAVFFIFYGAMNYREHGFLSNDPLMIPRVVLGIALVAAYQSSLMLGVSSMFNQGRLAGATYAGVYVLTGVFAGMAKLVGEARDVAGPIQKVLDKIHYLSPYGGCEGILKSVLATDGSFFARGGGGSQDLVVPRPDLWLVFLVAVVPAVLAWWIAIARVRAVEVVK